MPESNLRTDPLRENSPSSTGIFVRALNSDGRWRSVDIVNLTRDSLISWLRSRGGFNPWAESVVLTLFGYPGLTPEESTPAP